MRIVVLCAVAAVLAVGCAPTPTEVCKSGVNTMCTRMFECQTDAVKTSDAFKAIYGASAADCKTKFEAAASCDARKNYDEACTGANAGKKYDLGKASECSNQTKALSCTDFLDTAKTPAACSQVCQ